MYIKRKTWSTRTFLLNTVNETLQASQDISGDDLLLKDVLVEGLCCPASFTTPAPIERKHTLAGTN